MNLRVLAPVMLAFLLPAAAMAGINTTKPMGPMSLYIYPDGTGEMVNDGDVPFQFVGYTILSQSGLLGWDIIGINDNTWLNMVGTTCYCPYASWIFDNPCGEWQEMSETPYNYSEVTMSEGVTFPPNCAMNMGRGFLGGTQEDLTFTYVDSSTAGSWEGAVIVVPEPCTLALLGLGALAFRRRR